MALQEEWTPEKFLEEKVKPHYAELKQQFDSGKLDQVWFEKQYRDKVKLRDRSRGHDHKGPKEIHEFWKEKRANNTGDIGFDFKLENVRVFPVAVRSPHPHGSNDVVEIGVFLAGYQIGNAVADPPFDGLWLHWEDCSWQPESEDLGR